MFHNHSALNSKAKYSNKAMHKQKGNMIMMSLFLIIVVSLLAAMLIRIVSASSNSTIYQIYGLRAQQAAQAGVQNLLQYSFPADGSLQVCNQTISSPAALSSSSGLSSCLFSAVCETQSIQFANVDYLYFKYSSTGSCQVGDSIVSRTVSVDAMQEG